VIFSTFYVDLSKHNYNEKIIFIDHLHLFGIFSKLSSGFKFNGFAKDLGRG